MRYYLAAVPALAIAAGYGAAWAWNGAAAAPPVVARRRRGLSGGNDLDRFHNWWSALG